MFNKLYHKLRNSVYYWLTYEPPTLDILPYDYSRLKSELRPGDVLLVEGRSRMSGIISTITQSPWTHAALYIGRLADYEEDEDIYNIIANNAVDVKPGTRLIIEDLLDRGTVIVPLNYYRHHHIRICRPIGITPSDVHLVINYAVQSLGQPYNVRQIFDLARFLLPWKILPRRWGSSLFRTSSGLPESGVCTSLIAEAFNSVHFPILPYIIADKQLGVSLYQRNPYLFTPKDFDYSPYFDIIKYPLTDPNQTAPYYRRMPWSTDGRIYQDHGILSAPKKKKVKNETVDADINKDDRPESD